MLSKDWTDLFSMKIEGVIICALCCKYHKIRQNSRGVANKIVVSLEIRQYVNLAIVMNILNDSKQSSGAHVEYSIVAK